MVWEGFGWEPLVLSPLSPPVVHHRSFSSPSSPLPSVRQKAAGLSLMCVFALIRACKDLTLCLPHQVWGGGFYLAVRGLKRSRVWVTWEHHWRQSAIRVCLVCCIYCWRCVCVWAAQIRARRYLRRDRDDDLEQETRTESIWITHLTHPCPSSDCFPSNLRLLSSSFFLLFYQFCG